MAADPVKAGGILAGPFLGESERDPLMIAGLTCIEPATLQPGEPCMISLEPNIRRLAGFARCLWAIPAHVALTTSNVPSRTESRAN